jgi:hypothetical protein
MRRVKIARTPNLSRAQEHSRVGTDLGAHPPSFSPRGGHFRGEVSPLPPHGSAVPCTPGSRERLTWWKLRSMTKIVRRPDAPMRRWRPGCGAGGWDGEDVACVVLLVGTTLGLSLVLTMHSKRSAVSVVPPAKKKPEQPPPGRTSDESPSFEVVTFL